MAWCSFVKDPAELEDFDQRQVERFRALLFDAIQWYASDNPKNLQYIEIEVRLGKVLDAQQEAPHTEWQCIEKETRFDHKVAESHFEALLAMLQSKARDVKHAIDTCEYLTDRTRVSSSGVAVCKRRLFDVQVCSTPRDAYDLRVSVSFEEPRIYEYFVSPASRVYNQVEKTRTRDRTTLTLNDSVFVDFTRAQTTEENGRVIHSCEVEFETSPLQEQLSDCETFCLAMSQEIVKNIRLAKHALRKTIV